MKMSQEEEFTPRAYQVDLYEKALTGNTIIYLPTGSGKTYVVVMVIKKLSSEVRKSWSEGGKRTIFLVNTVPLVAQQCAYIARHSDLTCNGYTGDMNVDIWDANMWTQEFHNNQVLVMTAQILLDILSHGYLPLSRINLIIFDECHHAVGDHPMRLIMKRFEDCAPSLHPKVLGTSATLLNSNVKEGRVDTTVHDLEITFNAKVITVDSMTPVKGYGKPTESITFFDPPEKSCIHDKVEDYIDYANAILDSVNLSEMSPYSDSSRQFQPRSKGSKLKCVFEDIREHFETKGLFPASKALLYHMIQLVKLKVATEDLQSVMVLDFLITQMTLMQKTITDEMKGSSLLEKILAYSSNQIHKLFHVILRYNSDNSLNTHKFCCLIFVQRKYTAKILYYVLKSLASEDERFKFLVPQYVVGTTSDVLRSPCETMCMQKWNEEALTKFRAGFVNCLVATDLLDEGIDIPACRLVIHYDAPNNFRAYVQSKGRARHKDSQYVIFVMRNSTFLERYKEYRKIERTLSQKLIGNCDRRLKPLPEELKLNLFTSAIEPFSVVDSNGVRAVITETSAISVINRYCSTLSQSKFVTCAPVWNLDGYKNGDENDEQYRVTLKMPISSPLRVTIYGDVMSTITLAKRSAAIKGCKKLYEIGELNDRLLPKNAEEIVEDISLILSNWEEENDENKKRVGTMNFRRSHDIVYPDALYGAFPMPNQDCYLHVISMKPTYSVPTENRNWVVYNCLSEPAGYAILSSKEIPPIPDFPIFMNVGASDVKLNVNYTKVHLSADEIMELRRFHWVIFKEVLELVKSFMIFDKANKENCFLIVPIDEKWNIDWDVVRRYPSIRQETSQDHPLRAITNDDSPTQVIDECGWELVTPNYRSSTSMYMVTRVCDDLMPKSAFPTEDYRSFSHYFHERHGLNIIDQNQPMLEVKPISKKINCIKRRDYAKTTNKRKRSDLEEHLVPELCSKVVFPQLYWLKATVLPSILHRVSQLLIADDLRRKIADETGLGVVNKPISEEWRPLIFLQDDSEDNKDSENESNHDESNLLENVISELQTGGPEIDVLSLDSTRYPWSEEREPCDLERNIENLQFIDIEYYHSFTKTSFDLNDQRIRSKYQKKGYATKPDIPVPSLKVLTRAAMSIGPSPADIIPALTPKSASDLFNLERLETLGDSYLKYITSIYLFEVHPSFTEGRLTTAKGTIIGNRHLYYCGKSQNIPGRLKIDEFEPMSNFIVPAYCTSRELQTFVKSKNKAPNVLYELIVPVNEQLEGELSVNSESKFHAEIESWVDAKGITGVEQFVGFQVVPDKTISDSVESLTGVYLNCMGLNGAARLLKWFGVLPSGMQIDRVLHAKPSSARIGSGDVDRHIPFANYIENVLGYKFVDRSFLLQAFTHPSYTSNTITASYDRLEFLGDALIDFLITVYIYENCGDLSPGALTDLRSALVNNITFACESVKYGLHTALLAYAPLLSEKIERFVKYQEERNHKVDDELLWILSEENDVNMAESVDVPKILGDLFESVIGAIYLDSGKNLGTVWNIIYCLMYTEIHSFSKNVPKQPVRVLLETPGSHATFLESGPVPGCDAIMVSLEVTVHGKKKLFNGFGATKKQAKAAAAKLALKSLRHKVQCQY